MDATGTPTRMKPRAEAVGRPRDGRGRHGYACAQAQRARMKPRAGARDVVKSCAGQPTRALYRHMPTTCLCRLNAPGCSYWT